jgi:hypothetical protein
MKKTLLAITLMSFSYLNAQVFSNKEVGKKQEQTRDSLKQTEYPYVLPIWGDKATKAGFSLPYSAGLSVQYIWQESDIIIENLKVGFNNGEMYDLSNVIEFTESKSTASGVNLRPDVWVFPFLNVYGILAKSQISTQISANVNIPDSNGNWQTVSSLSTVAEFNAQSFGFGFTPTIGVAGGFMAIDMNFTWNDIPELDKPAFAFIFGPRFGKSFKLKKPERSIAFWVGGFRLHLNSGTQGSIPIGDLFDGNTANQKIDNAYTEIDNKQNEIDTWWGNLTPVEQKNPANVAKYETANKALESAGNLVSGLDQAVNKVGSSTVQYSLDKRPKDKWNFVVGSQFQLNKHWMARFEYGFLGTRNQFIGGLQYRFGL